jgi:hypothetical protein
MAVRVATVSIEGLSPFSPSRAFDPDVSGRNDNESADDHEKRVWRKRIHYNQDGVCIIPAMMIQLMIQSMAKRCNVRIPGQGQATYTKNFVGGVAVPDDAIIPGTNWETVRGEWFHLNADGKRGGGTRVWRCMPMIDKWSIKFEAMVFDDLIPKELFERVIREGGLFCGFGRFSPRKGGTNGRYQLKSIEWSDMGE